jgi:predicted transcriptional regulator
MEYYVITRLGRQIVPLLREKGRDDEADILDYLRLNGAATVEQITILNESEVRLKLRILAREKWVKRRRMKALSS